MPDAEHTKPELATVLVLASLLAADDWPGTDGFRAWIIRRSGEVKQYTNSGQCDEAVARYVRSLIAKVDPDWQQSLAVGGPTISELRDRLQGMPNPYGAGE